MATRGGFSKHTFILFIAFAANIGIKKTLDNRNNVDILHNSANCVQKLLEPFMIGDLWTLWDRFAYVVNKCTPNMKDIELGEFPNTDELKYHYMPIRRIPNCSVLSLGIGKDVKAEKKMKAVLPNCEFYGADPVQEDNEDLFVDFGKFYNMAVGDKNGSFRSYVLEEIYRYQEVVTIDLATFIRLNVKQTTIDQLMIDIEHAEYPVLPFFEQNGQLEEWGIHICQINIEVHSPTDEDRQTFTDFLKRNFISHQWIFINSEMHPILKHIRLFMINGRNEECLRRYIQKESKVAKNRRGERKQKKLRNDGEEDEADNN